MPTTTTKISDPKTKVKKVTASKKLSLRLGSDLYNIIIKQAALQNRTVSNFLINVVVGAIDTTEYSLASSKNTQILQNRLSDLATDELSKNSLSHKEIE